MTVVAPFVSGLFTLGWMCALKPVCLSASISPEIHVSSFTRNTYVYGMQVTQVRRAVALRYDHMGFRRLIQVRSNKLQVLAFNQPLISLAGVLR